MVPRDLPGAEAAAIVHVGSYDLMAETYEALGRRIGAKHFQIAGPAREIYPRPPNEEGGPITGIQWAVEND